MKKFLYIFFILLQGILIAGNNDKVKAPSKHVSGKITTTKGEAIAGVKIIIKETNEIFFADLDGNFKLQLKTDKSYSISILSPGFAPLEVKSSSLSLFSGLSLVEL